MLPGGCAGRNVRIRDCRRQHSAQHGSGKPRLQLQTASVFRHFGRPSRASAPFMQVCTAASSGGGGGSSRGGSNGSKADPAPHASSSSGSSKPGSR